MIQAPVSNKVVLVECVEQLVESYNEDFAIEFGQETASLQKGLPAVKPPNFIDISALEDAVVPAARRRTAFLVGIAQAEALDALGENRAAVTIMERHV